MGRLSRLVASMDGQGGDAAATAAGAGAAAEAEPPSFPYRCSKCGGCSANCVAVVNARHGSAKHAFSCTYDGYGCAETGAGERVHLVQFRDHWAELKWDLELRFAPAAHDVYCLPAAAGAAAWSPGGTKIAGGLAAAHSRSCAPKGLVPQRALRALRESLTACKDVQAAGEKAAAAAAAAAAHAAAVAQLKPAKPAAAPAAAAVLVTKATASEEAMPAKAGRRAPMPLTAAAPTAAAPAAAALAGAKASPNTRGAKRAGEALLPPPRAAKGAAKK